LFLLRVEGLTLCRSWFFRSRDQRNVTWRQSLLFGWWICRRTSVIVDAQQSGCFLSTALGMVWNNVRQ